MTAAVTFTDIRRFEHRELCDLLLAVIDAFRTRDTSQARAPLARIAASIGPHFRYEAESLYPSLTEVIGPTKVARLLRDHDVAMRSVRRLLDLADMEVLDEAHLADAVTAVWSILPHISDCDGLAIMAECLPEKQVHAILDARQRALEADVDLFTGASIRPD